MPEQATLLLATRDRERCQNVLAGKIVAVVGLLVALAGIVWAV